MSVCFFATPVASGYSKGEWQHDTSIFVLRVLGSTRCELREMKRPGSGFEDRGVAGGSTRLRGLSIFDCTDGIWTYRGIR